MRHSTIFFTRFPRPISYRRFGALLFGLVLLAAFPASAQTVLGIPEDHDRLGYAVAAGDFDGDGTDDLATGAPGENNGQGAVIVVYGDTDGLNANNDEAWSQATPGILGVPESGDRFGHALAVGDFDGNGYDDLAVGSPTEDIGAVADAGAVNVIYGQVGGLSATGNQVWTQDELIGSDVETDDRFGEVLATGDFNGDGYDDLAVGVPFEDIFGTPDTGIVHVIYGSANGLTLADNEQWSLANTSPFNTAEFTRFGFSLAAGDFRPAIEVPRDELADVAQEFLESEGLL